MALTHRISAGVLVEQDSRVLLLRNFKIDRYDFWVAPGGGVEGMEDLTETAKRETFEECGLRIKTQQLAYVEDLIWADGTTRQCKLWFIAHCVGGQVDLSLNPSVSECIIEAAWLSREQMLGKKIYPSVLLQDYWNDKISGFVSPRYLGMRQMTN
jgi:8-oxo-dGTP diphosphatase